MMARTSPRKATLISSRSTIERIKVEIETIFTLASHECKGDLRWANLSISGRCILLFTLSIVISLTVPGNILTKLSFLSISRQGVRLSLLISLRAISAALLVFPMLGTTRFYLTLKALQKIKIPAQLIQLLMFTYRYIFFFLDEERRVFIGATSRGWVRKTNLSSLKTIGSLVGMLLVHSFERTERIRDAMVSRGYNGRVKTLDEFTLSAKDFIKASLIIAIALLLNLFRWIR